MMFLLFAAVLTSTAAAAETSSTAASSTTALGAIEPLPSVETSTPAATESLTVEELEALEGPARPLDAALDLDAMPEEERIVQEIEVSEERLAEAARQDTDLRLTGRQLVERGVTNLGQALDLLPDVSVRVQGRGGVQADLRGGRKGAVMVILDGAPIAEPFNGNF